VFINAKLGYLHHILQQDFLVLFFLIQVALVSQTTENWMLIFDFCLKYDCMKHPFAFLLFLTLSSCIGTDELEDPIVGARIESDIAQLALLIGDTASLTATYFDQYGLQTNVQVGWEVADTEIATIDETGLVTAITPGQTTAIPVVGPTTGSPTLITVVASADEVAQVTVTGPVGNQMEVGATFQLQFTAQTVGGMPIEVLEAAWFSSNPDVLSISPTGLATGIANGAATVYAVVNGVQSNMLPILVGNTERTGTFSSANGYETSGMARLYYASTGDLMLELSSDFETEFALGTFVYLSNSISGTTTAANGLEIAGISTNGFKLYNVSTIAPSVGIDTFSRVIILCKPASITFGHATMQ
jgi:hypothetical protein